MLTPVPPTDCMLARESASARLDNELSELENARLDAHLRGCAECLAYAEEIGAIAVRLRAAALERPGERIVLPRRRIISGARMQAAVAAAAVAVVAAVAGSSFTLGHVLGVHKTPEVRASATTADLASLRADSTEQHLLALLPQLQPPHVARSGGLRAI
jgi:predicted anti-sigma-YlaC factor YlaD